MLKQPSEENVLPYIPELHLQASLNNILHDTFSLLLNPPLRMGSLSLDVIFKLLTTESTSQIEAGRMS